MQCRGRALAVLAVAEREASSFAKHPLAWSRAALDAYMSQNFNFGMLSQGEKAILINASEIHKARQRKTLSLETRCARNISCGSGSL